MTPYRLYGLELQCDGLYVEGWLNGLRVYLERDGARRFTAKKLNPWLVDGTNGFEVRMARLGSATPYLRLAIAHTDGQEDEPDPANFVLRYEWNADEQPVEDQLVSVVRHPFDVVPAHGPWSWQSATPYTDADRPGVEAAVADLHAVLGRKDTQGYVDRLRVKMAEMARALSVPASELETDLREALAERFAQSDWQMEPLDPSSLRIEPSAGGQVVSVTDARGKAPIRGSGSQTDYELGEVTLSHLPQGWTVVR